LRKFATLLAFGLAVYGAAQVDPNRTIVVVNGEEVKGAEYYRRMEFLPGVGKLFSGSFAEFPPGFLTLEQIITERLVIQLAKEKGVLPTDAEVEAEVKAAETETPKDIEAWLAGGRTREELVYQTRYNLSQFRLYTRGITVTDGEVEKFYTDNPTLFTIPKQLDLKIIVVTSEDAAKAVDADLAAGKKFEDVSKERSVDVSKVTGGNYGKVSWDDLSKEARAALENVQVGQTTGWIVSQETRVKFLLAGVTPPAKRPLDAALKRSIRREQMLTKGRIANDVQKEMNQLRKRSTIDIKEKSFASSYKQFIDTFLGTTGGG